MAGSGREWVREGRGRPLDAQGLIKLDLGQSLLTYRDEVPKEENSKRESCAAFLFVWLLG